MEGGNVTGRFSIGSILGVEEGEGTLSLLGTHTLLKVVSCASSLF